MPRRKKVLDLTAPLEIIDFLMSEAFFVDADGVLTPTCADPDDIKFLQAAIVSKSKYLISGDKHLLDVGKYTGGMVIKAQDFLTYMAAHH